MKCPKWLKSKPIELPWRCEHCGINLGWHLVDYVKDRSESYCPRCGRPVLYNLKTDAIKTVNE